MRAAGGAAAEHAAHVLQQPRRLRQAATQARVTTGLTPPRYTILPLPIPIKSVG